MPRRIPLSVFQIWLQGAAVVPQKYDKARASWKAQHPASSGWSVTLLDEGDIERTIAKVASDFPDLSSSVTGTMMTPDKMLAWYRALPKMIYKCDVGRCFQMYGDGGVYADTDTLSLQPLTPLLDEAEAAADANGAQHALVYCKTVNNAVFAASPRHPLFVEAWWPQVYDAISGGRKLMGGLSRALSVCGPGLDVVIATGPLMWGRILDGGFPFGGGMSDEQRRAWGIMRPPHHAFYPKMSDSGRLDTLSEATKANMASQGSYTYHSQESEWLTGVSVESVFMAMTNANTRRAILVSLCAALLLAALLYAAVAALRQRSTAARASLAGRTGGGDARRLYASQTT